MDVILYVIIAVVLIALFVWLLLGRSEKAKPAQPKQPEAPMRSRSAPGTGEAVLLEEESPAAPPTEQKPPSDDDEFVQLRAAPGIDLEPAADQPCDDLTIIEGIGPKINSVLQQAGITTFTLLANTPPAKIDEILHAANLRLADPESWPEQARLAAVGDQAGLQALQDRLKGGRTV